MPITPLSGRDFVAHLKGLGSGSFYWDGVIPVQPGYSLLVGEPGQGKTNFELCLGAHLALGIACLGFATTQTRVSLILFEGGASLASRIEKMQAFYECDIPGFDMALETSRSLKSLETDLIKAFSGYGLGIIDPLNVVFWGNPNNGQDALENIKILNHISRESGAHLLIAHHTRKTSNDPRAKFIAKDINDVKGSGDLVAGSVTTMLLRDEYQQDLRDFGLAHHRGAPSLRGSDYKVLDFVRAQASADSLGQIGLWFNRDTLQFQRSDVIGFAGPPALQIVRNGTHAG